MPFGIVKSLHYSPLTLKSSVAGFLGKWPGVYHFSQSTMKPSRRNFLQSLGVGVAVSAVSTAAPSVVAASGPPKATKPTGDDQILFMGDNIAIANTEHGKVRGFILRGIHQFLGIPYGADTSGRNRFMPPQKPTAWLDVRPALWWGNSAPQIMEKRYSNPYASFVDHWNYDDVSEDCLKINVWTPALDTQKRPVSQACTW